MYAARIQFGRIPPSQRDPAGHAVHGYLAALLKNGQISVYILTVDDAMEACVELPRPNSLSPRFHSRWVRSELKGAIDVFERPPRTLLVGSPGKSSFPSWQRAKSLYLYTDMLDRGPPVRSPELEISIPLYLLPLGERVREQIHFWASSYREHDSICMGSRDLEMPAYRQLADPTSGLARCGRELCKTIEKATRKPTYYYLHRYWCRRSGEESRPCPSCGGRWAVTGNRKAVPWWVRMDFCCQRCRLVSCVGVEIDERHARIGEPRSKR